MCAGPRVRQDRAGGGNNRDGNHNKKRATAATGAKIQVQTRAGTTTTAHAVRQALVPMLDGRSGRQHTAVPGRASTRSGGRHTPAPPRVPRRRWFGQSADKRCPAADGLCAHSAAHGTPHPQNPASAGRRGFGLATRRPMGVTTARQVANCIAPTGPLWCQRTARTATAAVRRRLGNSRGQPSTTGSAGAPVRPSFFGLVAGTWGLARESLPRLMPPAAARHGSPPLRCWAPSTLPVADTTPPRRQQAGPLTSVSLDGRGVACAEVETSMICFSVRSRSETTAMRCGAVCL